MCGVSVEVKVAVMVAVRVAVRVAMLCPRRLKRCNQGRGQCDGPPADEMESCMPDPQESACRGRGGGYIRRGSIGAAVAVDMGEVMQCVIEGVQ